MSKDSTAISLSTGPPSLRTRLLGGVYAVALAAVFVIAGSELAYLAVRTPVEKAGVLTLDNAWLFAWSAGMVAGGVGIIAGVAWRTSYAGLMIERTGIIVSVLTWGSYAAVSESLFRFSWFGTAQIVVIIAVLLARLLAISHLAEALRVVASGPKS